MRVATPIAPLRVLLVAFALGLLPACSVLKPAGYAAFEKALAKGPALQVYDTLETLIANEEDTRGDRKAAFRAVRDAKPEETAGYHFAWAGVAGRLVQQKGLLGADLLHDIEKHARRSVELDPDFRAGAATRLLGTMYVVAPSTFLEHGDSELGLEMLETLVAAHPADPQNHLRLAEAYITLNDPVPAAPHLCFCLAIKDRMRRDEQKLLTSLMADAGRVDCTPPAPPANGGKKAR